MSSVITKIMVVDNAIHTVELTKAVLEEEGFEVIPAYSGQECLDKLKTVKPDLILMDVFMPEMSGLETCKKIRENPKTKDIKIIIITILKSFKLTPNERKMLKEIKALDFITKPFDNKDLLQRIKKALKD